jgi:hypothetical protein
VCAARTAIQRCAQRRQQYRTVIVQGRKECCCNSIICCQCTCLWWTDWVGGWRAGSNVLFLSQGCYIAYGVHRVHSVHPCMIYCWFVAGEPPS